MKSAAQNNVPNQDSGEQGGIFASVKKDIERIARKRGEKSRTAGGYSSESFNVQSTRINNISLSKEEQQGYLRGSTDFMKSGGYGNDLSNRRKISSASVGDLGENRQAADSLKKEREDAKQEEGVTSSDVRIPNRESEARSMRRKTEAVLKAAKAKVESRRENRSELNAMSTIIIFVAFFISIVSDLLDVVVDGTGVGALLAPISSLLVGPIVGFLWWSLGAGNTNDQLKKGTKRLCVAFGVESIPLIDLLPAMTFLCVVNLCDYLGYFDNKDWLKTLITNRKDGSIS
jgi:hypothetical protein